MGDRKGKNGRSFDNMKTNINAIFARITLVSVLMATGAFGVPSPAEAAGVIGWTAGGVDVAPNQNAVARAGNQSNTRAIPDGSGGVWAVFEDGESGTDQIRLQHLSSSGTRLLGNQGVLVDAAAGEQQFPEVVSDGASGVYVVWSTFRNGSDWDVYAQRFNSSGVAQWTANGVGVATGGVHEIIEAQYGYSSVVSDGSGNLYIAFRNGFTTGVQAQKLNASGTAQWTAGGVDVTTTNTGSGRSPGVIDIDHDGSGGIFVVWQDNRNSPTTTDEVWAQRINSSGSAVAAANGVQIGANNGKYNDQAQVVTVGSDAFIVWNSTRTADVDGIYAQKINSSVVAQWTANGVAIQSGESYNHHVILDGSGGAFISMVFNPSSRDVYVQRIDGTGAKQWGTNGTQVTSGNGNDNRPMLASDGSGGAIVEWFDQRGITSLYAQRLNSSGTVQWTANGIQQSPYAVIEFSFAGDGTGNTYSGFGGAFDGDVYAQKTDSSGSPQWNTTSGARLQSTGGAAEQDRARVVADGDGNYFYAWEDRRFGQDYIFAQKVNADGEPQWADDGVQIGTFPGDNAFLVSDDAGGVIVVWNDGDDDENVKALRLDSDGTVHSGWAAGGVEVIAAPYPFIHDAVSDGAGGVIVSAMDGDEETYITSRITAAGATPWGTTGVDLMNPANDCGLFDSVASVPDGAGGAFYAWTEFDFDNFCSGMKLKITRRDSNGSLHAGWTAHGNVVTTDPQSSQASVVSDGAGNAIVAFWSNQASDIIKAQKYNGSGAAQWTANGVVLSDDTGEKVAPQAVSDGAGGAAVAWTSNSEGLLVQRVNSSGVTQWGSTGVQLDLGNVQGGEFDAVTDGNGGIIVAWYDARVNGGIFAQRVNVSGSAQWTTGGEPVATGANSGELYQGNQLYGNTYAIAPNGESGVVIAYKHQPGGSIYQIRTQTVCEDTCPTAPSTNDPTLNNRITLSRLKANTASTVAISFTLQNELTGTFTATFPAGFSVTGAMTSGSCSGGGTVGTFAFNAGTRTMTAEKSACSGTLTLSGGTVTTPASPGLYTVAWTNDDPGSGVVAIVDDDQVSITAQVASFISFDVDTAQTDTESAAPYAVSLGTVTMTDTRVSGAADGVNFIWANLDTNASAGAIVTVRNQNGANGLVSTSNPADDIDSAAGAVADGVENYGICSVAETDTTGNIDDLAPFNGTCAGNTEGNTVGGFTGSDQQIYDTDSAPVAGGRVQIAVQASISSSTAAHSDYADTLTFVATGTY